MSKDIGIDVGEVCNRKGCELLIQEKPVVDCSCHINPPCGACTDPRLFCECGWDQSEETVVNDHIVQVDKNTGIYKLYGLRSLDNSTIDWHSKSHTHFSMIKEGVYPEGTTKEEVESKVRGTFGGRFDYCANGKFKYIAYTD